MSKFPFIAMVVYLFFTFKLRIVVYVGSGSRMDKVSCYVSRSMSSLDSCWRLLSAGLAVNGYLFIWSGEGHC